MKKYIILLTLLSLVSISFAYDVAYIPEIDTSSIGYDSLNSVNTFGDGGLYNPASLTFDKGNQISFSYYDYLNLELFNLQQFYFRQPLKNGFAGLFSIQRTYSKDPDTKFDNYIYDYRFSSISNNTSLGFAIKYITLNSFYYNTSDSSQSNVSYLSGDLGIISKIGYFAVGGVAKNVISYKFNSESLNIPSEYIFGINYTNNFITLGTSVGKTLNSPEIWGGFFTGLKISNFVLRAGIRANTDFNETHLKDFSLGIRARISNILIDYAFKSYFSHVSEFYLQNNSLTFSFMW